MRHRIALEWTAGVLLVASAAVVGSSLLGTACSSSGGGDAGPTADQACSDNARAQCLKAQSCTPAGLLTGYGSETVCEARVKATCLDALSAPSTGANPDKAEACAQAYANYGCVDYRNKANIPAPCQPTMGPLPSGSPCEYEGQCESAFCAIVPGSACGKCAVAPSPGDSCANLTTCGADLTCTSDTLVCTLLAGQGQPCGPGQPCGAGLSCVAPAGPGTAGTCQTAGAAAGVTCDGSLKTGPGCDNALSLYCDGLTKACAQATYASPGKPCGYGVDAGTNVLCAAGACVGADVTRSRVGQCAGRAMDEGACSVPDGGASVTNAGCLPSARCIGASGRCQAVSASTCK